MAATMSAAGRPAIRGTRVSILASAEWQPVHDAAPGGGTAGAAVAVAQANTHTAATAAQ